MYLLTELSRNRVANPSFYSDVFELEQITLSLPGVLISP